jgi:single-strand DNA-binding protein
MANDITLTVVGRLTADPELRYTQNGLAVANFTVASNARKWDRTANEFVDEDPVFLRCVVWREFAEHIAESLTKGTRVIVQGRLQQRDYTTKEGEKRSSMELEVDAMGPDLRFEARPPTSGEVPTGKSQDAWAAPKSGTAAGATGDVWNTPGANYGDDSTPF